MKLLKNLQFKKYSKLGLFIFLSFIAINFGLSAQDEKRDENRQSEKNHQFGFTIKRANYSYYPVEYENDSQGKDLLGLWHRPGLRKQSELFDSVNPKKLSAMRNNEQLINPFSLLYYNKKLNLNFEFSYYSLILDSPYYLASFLNIQPIPYNIGNIRRSENKLNIYSSVNLTENNSFFYGLGGRNIKKESYQRKGLSQNTIVDDTYGINIFLKYQYKIISNLSINFSVEPFYTYGQRSIKSDFIQSYGSLLPSPNDFRAVYNDPNAKIYFYGAELGINLSFNFFENLNLLVGYGFIYTKIRYENDKRLILTRYYDTNYLTYSGIYNHSTDHINNWYIGLNAKF
jgi:outer membrane protein (TIGR04327 family)